CCWNSTACPPRSTFSVTVLPTRSPSRRSSSSSGASTGWRSNSSSRSPTNGAAEAVRLSAVDAARGRGAVLAALLLSALRLVLVRDGGGGAGALKVLRGGQAVDLPIAVGERPAVQ